MTDAVQTRLLTAILDSLTLMQGQLVQIERRGDSIEHELAELHTRLDHIDAAQASVTDIAPNLESIFARMIADRKFAKASFTALASLGAITHAATTGRPAALPTDLLDDPLFERFMLTQPADHESKDRALVEWREAARSASTDELIPLLVRQYEPSPTDTPETRVLRYRLAAITRAELEGRGAALPALPRGTVANDNSDFARKARSEDLARVWRGGATPALYAEAELAGAVEIFAEAARREGTVGEEQLAAELASLYRQLADRIEAGERPSLAAEGRSQTTDRSGPVAGVGLSKDR